jgi:hypothetical protein
MCGRVGDVDDLIDSHSTNYDILVSLSLKISLFKQNGSRVKCGLLLS